MYLWLSYNPATGRGFELPVPLSDENGRMSVCLHLRRSEDKKACAALAHAFLFCLYA